MGDWLIKIGAVMAIVGGFFLSPLTALFPIDLWLSINNLFQSAPSASFSWIVPIEESGMLKIALFGIGLVLMVVGYYLKLTETE